MSKSDEKEITMLIINQEKVVFIYNIYYMVSQPTAFHCCNSRSLRSFGAY